MTYAELAKVVNTSELVKVYIDRTETTHRTERFYGTLNRLVKTYDKAVIESLEVVEIATTPVYDRVSDETFNILEITLKG